MGATKGAVQVIRSDKDTHFTGAITANNKEDEDLSMTPTGRPSRKRSNSGTITGIEIVSDENLVWRVYFWGKDTYDDTDADVDTFLKFIDFAANEAMQVGATGLWRATKEINPFAYVDEDGTYEIHVSLGIVSGSAKTAGGDGEAVVILTYIPDR